MSPRRSAGRSGFQLDSDAVSKLTDTPEARDLLAELGQAAVYNIRRLAPERTGRFKRSINADVRTVDGRPTAVVYSTSPVWHLLEYGSANTSPQRPFARGIASMPGVEYRPTPKGG